MATTTVDQVSVTQFYMNNKKVAIIQSNYIPWKGYFDLINMVDELILFDDVQYTRRDWRNRNKIKTLNGLQWLTIPVKVKGHFLEKIKNIFVNDPSWPIKHWKALYFNYVHAPYFSSYEEVFKDLYLNNTSLRLSEINYKFISAICKILDIKTKLSWSSNYHIVDGKTDRLINLCKQAGAGEYISGPSAKGYIDSVLFDKADIKLRYIDYSSYPEYPQIYPPFEHAVTILDLIFQTGPNASKYMLSFK